MSLTGDRQEIADALSTVEGVKGYKYRPMVAPKAGNAWPLLGPLERGPGTDFQATWRIVVVLPPTEQQASEWFDEMHEPIAEALEDFGFVELIEPGNLATDAGDMDVMILTLRREA
jgi:hypothetical protein